MQRCGCQQPDLDRPPYGGERFYTRIRVTFKGYGTVRTWRLPTFSLTGPADD